MTPRKLNVLFAVFAYGGNSGIKQEVSFIREWFFTNLRSLWDDPRIGEVKMVTVCETPAPMARNQAVMTARQLGSDVLVMIDSDAEPDCELRHDPEAQPFFQSSFDFLYKNYDAFPSVICAPHLSMGDHNEVCIGRWEDLKNSGDSRGPNLRIQRYPRGEACMMTGIVPAGSLSTTFIMFDMRAFDSIEPMDLRHDETQKDDKPWFYYEYTDHYCIKKASTEDATCTRDIALAQYAKYGKPTVFCNWDAWVGHNKNDRIGKPKPLTYDRIHGKLVRAIEEHVSSRDRIVEVGADEPGNPGDGSVPMFDLSAMPTTGVVRGSVNSVGSLRAANIQRFDLDATPGDRAAQAEMVRNEFERLGHLVRIVEVGSNLGRGAVVMADAAGQGNAIVTCVDHWKGSYSDESGETNRCLGGVDEVYKLFEKNVGDRLGKTVVPMHMSSVDAAITIGGREFDIVFIDAEHTYDACKKDIELWLRHLRDGGLLAGHDYHHESFPGVVKAVDEFVAEHGLELTILPQSTIWTCRPKGDYERQHELNGAATA